MHLKQRKTIGVMLSIYLLLITINIDWLIESETIHLMEERLFWFCLFSMVVETFVVIMVGLKLYSFGYVFIVLANLYNCGQLILNYFSRRLIYSWANVLEMGEQIYIENHEIGLKCIVAVFCGVICVHLLKSTIMIKNNIAIFDRQMVISTGFSKMLFWVSAPAALYLAIVQAYYGLMYGYDVMFSKMPGQAVAYVSNLFFSAVVLMMSQAKDSKKHIIYILYVCYCFIMMLGGARSKPLFNFLICTYILFFVIKRIHVKLSTLLIVMSCLYIVLEGMIGIRYARVNGLSWEGFTRAVEEHGNDVIFETLQETSITQAVLTETMYYKKIVAKDMDYGGGQLIGAITSIIPGISHIADMSGVSLQDNIGKSYLGGSFVADFYYDNHIIIYALLFGGFMQLIFGMYDEKKDIFYCALWAPIVQQLLFSVRTSTSNIPRLIVWHIAMVFIIYNFYRRFLWRGRYVNKSFNVLKSYR